MGTFTIDQRAISDLLLSPNSALVQSVDRAARRVTNQTKINLTTGTTKAVDTGRLRASIAYELRVSGTKITARVGTDVEYALHVHEGTGIYGPTGKPIVPKRAKVLRFLSSGPAPAGFIGPGGGGFVFAKQVSGSPPRPYLKKALDTLSITDFASA